MTAHTDGADDELIKHLARVIHDDLRDALRSHVFNNMPARLLDLHQLGEIQVIDRSEVHELLKERLRIWTEEKIIAWIKQQTRYSEDEGYTYPDRIRSCKLIVEEIARYAILSHRWLDIGEITFNKFTGRVSFDDLATQCSKHETEGLNKLHQFCTTAGEQLGCSLAWADTCCIDKTSSSELDEAIRSMFRWYRFAHVCVIYLAGTTSLDGLGKDTWFTRGWTLQEILAPPRLKFYSKDWVALCDGENDKENPELTRRVEERTAISESQLRDFQPGPFDIVQRMTWAARRVTTRIEDRAYSLIGVFDVNLIIAYGEGDKAFGRLMQEIYNKRPHYEVFLWEKEPASEYSSRALPASPASYLPYPDSVRDHRASETLAVSRDSMASDLPLCDDRAFKASHPGSKEWAGGRGSFGDANFALTNRGLRIKCLDVWVTLRCDPTKAPGKDIWILTLRPWHPLSRDIEDVIVLVDKQARDKFTEDRYSKAIGVLDYLRNESDHPGYVEKNGRLVEGREYFGWLLVCPTGYAEAWTKVMTYNTVRLRFKERKTTSSNPRNIDRPLIQVHL